jgi:hydrogenase expression/formation protein HypC
VSLGIPGRITEIHDETELRMGLVDFAGVVREVCLACVPEARVGSWVVAHLGFAVSTIEEAQAQRTLALRHTMGGVLREGPGGTDPADGRTVS